MKMIFTIAVIVFILMMLFPMLTTAVSVLSGKTEIIPQVMTEGFLTALKFSAITFLFGSLWKLWESDKKKWRRRP